MIIVWILLGLVVLLALIGVVMYNGLIGLRNKVEEGWRQIDVELKRRHDLIPNLVETVKGYAAHERGTLEEVMQARSAAMSGAATPAAAAQAEGQLSQALGRLLAVAEAYPDLKANQNFLALQSELTSTEDRIASSRRYYNALVRDLNTKVESVPSNIVANIAGVNRAEYFETPATEAIVPSVSFGGEGVGGSTPPPAVSASTQPGAVGGPSTQPGTALGALPQAQAPGAAQPDPTTDSGTPQT
jgi:LemA protein